MKIAIPVAGGRLSPHFGHCEEFFLIDVDPQTKEVIGSEAVQPPPHEPGLLPRWLNEQGATLIIAGGMGMRAKQLFDQNGIEVVVGAPVEEPENLVRSYLSGLLVTGNNMCDHGPGESECQGHQ